MQASGGVSYLALSWEFTSFAYSPSLALEHLYHPALVSVDPYGGFLLSYSDRDPFPLDVCVANTPFVPTYHRDSCPSVALACCVLATCNGEDQWCTVVVWEEKRFSSPIAYSFASSISGFLVSDVLGFRHHDYAIDTLTDLWIMSAPSTFSESITHFLTLPG